MIELRSAGDVLTLSFSRPPRNKPLNIGITLVVAAVAFFAFTQRVPGSAVLSFFLVTAGAVVAVCLIVLLPERTNVVAQFDKASRTVRVASSRSDGREETATTTFDQVRTLQLFQQRSKGTQLQVLTLVTRDGRKVFLAEERQRSGWLSPPFGEGMADIVNRIRHETGVGGIEELPMPIQAAGSIMGVGRH